MEKTTKKIVPNVNPRARAKMCGVMGRQTKRPCTQPGMKNGRCRLHGGYCTGPKTAAGRARIATARTTHGLRTKAALTEKQRIKELIKETHEENARITNL
jgi:hypothetical protein